MSTADVSRITVVGQLFVLYTNRTQIALIIANVTADDLLAGLAEEIRLFNLNVCSIFKISKSIIYDEILFSGRYITQNLGGKICISMTEYMNKLNPSPQSNFKEGNKNRSQRKTKLQLSNAFLDY